jgi:undecaprenyl-diphosphatase
MRKILLTFCLLLTQTFFSQTADFRILKAMYGKDRPVWDKTMRYTSASVYVAMPLSIVIPLGDGYYNNNKVMYRNAVKTGVAIGLAEGISYALKYAVKRERPYTKYPTDFIARDHPGTFSFPSGHTTAAFASATAMTLTYKKWYVAVPAFTYAGLVGYSRMRLGVHYPSDVLAGMVIGVGAGYLTWQIDKWLR